MTYSDIVKGIEKLPAKLLVLILELLVTKIELLSLSEMAEKEGKSRNGILKSKRYKKIKIGRTTLAVKGIRNDEDEFPW